MIKLIATDIDGTFLNDQNEYPVERFNQQLKQMQQFGIHFVVASGNQYHHLQDIFKEKSPVNTFISENGGLIMHRNQVIDAEPLPQPQLRMVLQRLTHDPAFADSSINLSGRNGNYMEKGDRLSDDPEMQYYFSNIKFVSDLAAVQDEIYKVNLISEHAKVAPNARYLTQILPTEFQATPSGFGSIDIIPTVVNKGTALALLEDYWQLNPNQVMAFGDNLNDAEMLQHAHYGYAMKNARPELKAQASFVTNLDNNSAGVFDVIDQVLTRVNE
ncbi:haloacid dehalogenase [Loigolactobacillus backii]|uniref:Cof-type HAD-IIB family hydrolase n=1 Tax=Loigolactobacillus backii TaxID=375175 RepID=UPI000C1CAE0A|nr:Cof-type HAD-IIB family hydrolase [Loigolactobacillus backii]PIO82594.1 haloacid dehalogenase [Loigolactobacillus backii]